MDNALNQSYSEFEELQFPSLEAIKDVINIFSELEDSTEIHTYIVTEYFPYNDKDIRNSKKLLCDYIPKLYELINIKMEVEDGIALCSDTEGILEGKMYNGTPLTLQAFLIDKITYIGFQDKQITISFDNGYIRINY